VSFANCKKTYSRTRVDAHYNDMPAASGGLLQFKRNKQVSDLSDKSGRERLVPGRLTLRERARRTEMDIVPVLMFTTLGAVLLIAVWQFASFLRRRRNREAAKNALLD
jgi:hypothetical protein